MRPTRGFGVLEGVLARWRARAVLKLLPASLSRLIDIGCGQPMLLLQGVQAECRIGLLDNGLTWLQEMLSDTADAITMLAVIEHLTQDDAQNLLTECYRVLRPGGMLVLTSPPASTVRLLRLLARCRIISRTEIADHQMQYSPVGMYRLLEQAGFGRREIEWSYFALWCNMWFRAWKAKE